MEKEDQKKINILTCIAKLKLSRECEGFSSFNATPVYIFEVGIQDTHENKKEEKPYQEN